MVLLGNACFLSAYPSPAMLLNGQAAAYLQLKWGGAAGTS